MREQALRPQLGAEAKIVRSGLQNSVGFYVRQHS